MSTLGYQPQWMPDGSQILVVVRPLLENASLVVPPIYLVGLDGAPPKRILEDVLTKFRNVNSIAQHPDGQRITFSGHETRPTRYWSVRLAGGAPVLMKLSNAVLAAMKDSQFRGGAYDGRVLAMRCSSRVSRMEL